MTDDADLDIGIPELEQSKPLIVKITEVNQAFDQELATWQRHGLHPANLGINMFFLNNQVGSLIEYLVKIIPEFDPREFELKWKEDLLLALTQARLNIIAEKTKQDITAGIVDGKGNPIVIPKRHE